MNCPTDDEALAAAAESPEFEAGEAKEVEVKEEDEKPRILLKRQSKDETTGMIEFRGCSSIRTLCTGWPICLRPRLCYHKFRLRITST